ncbi:MAG: YCF48-related protein [Tahibacter sp.]
MSPLRVPAVPRGVLHIGVLLLALTTAATVVAQQTAADPANAPAAATPGAAPTPTSAAAPVKSIWPDPASSNVEPMPLASRTLLLDLVEAGKRAVAVGERGIVLVSDDRSQWSQVVDVPTRATLTAVAAVGNKVWAVGRDGVIIASADAGLHWTLQRSDPWRPAAADAADDARHGAPLLDVLFIDEIHGFAIGAYSLFLETSDGGTTWTPRSILGASSDGLNDAKGSASESGTFSREQLKIADESEPHFNALARTSDGSLLIAGERGSLLRSRDNGAHWDRTKLPYDGSMFGALGFDGQRAIVFGLRGHVFETDDLGDHWREVKTGTELSLLGGTRLRGGGIALVGANGLVLMRRNATEALHAGTVEPAGALAAILPSEGAATFVVAGENGIGRYQPK